MCNNNVNAIMKKIYSFLFAATALFAAASCQKEVAPEVETPNYEKITFTASTEVDTKTALHENGKSTVWVDGDQISVFDANKDGNNRCFDIHEITNESKTATFSYEGEFVMDKTQEDPTVVALHPYQEGAYCDFFYYDRNYITGINFPAAQTAVAGSFDSNAAFALGLGTMSNKVLGFQNLYALLKFTVRDAGVKKVTVKVNEGAYIAGDAKIQMVLNTEKIGGSEPVFESPVLSIVENGKNVITLTCDEGFNTEATYYVAVAPTTFTSISLYCDDVRVNHKDATMTLEANKIYNLKDNGSPKQERNLAFSAATATATVGKEFTAPSLSGETEGGVKYESSNPTVADFDASGNLKIKAAGTTTITAKADESRYYLAGEASYELTVVPPVILYIESEYTSVPMNIYAWGLDGVELPSAWPGQPLSWDSEKNKYYYEFPSDIKDKELSFIVNVDGYQTADLKITIDEYTETYAINWKWVYLKVNSNWKQSSAWFAGRFWTDNSTDYWSKLISVPNKTDVWGCVIPNNHTKVIFTRMNSANKNNMNWDNVWNQTNDLTIPTDGNNLYTIASGAWSKGSGTWSKLTF